MGVLLRNHQRPLRRVMRFAALVVLTLFMPPTPPALAAPPTKPALSTPATSTPAPPPHRTATAPAAPRRTGIGPQAGMTYYVGTIADDSNGADCTVPNNSDCSLRQAITLANANVGLDTINFSIAGPGVPVITLLSGLVISDPVLIDGYTQPGAAANTLASGTNATLLIQVDGGSAGSSSGLVLNPGSDGSTIRGLSVTNFMVDGIVVASANDLIAGNWLGVTPGGTPAANTYGVDVLGGSHTTIGGTTPDTRNLISGNRSAGVGIFGPGDGLAQIMKVVVQGNLIGTDATGAAPLPNSQVGVYIAGGAATNTVGGQAPGAANVIAYHGNSGVQIGDNAADTGAVGNTIQGNSIHDNGSGIVLSSVGFSQCNSTNTGPNDAQNSPSLFGAAQTGGGVTIAGVLNSLPGTAFHLDVYASPSNSGQGQTFLGGIDIATTSPPPNDPCSVNFSASFGAIPGQPWITVTATRSTTGDTSQFSNPVDTATGLAATAGTPQSTQVGSTFGTALQATVTDTLGAGIANTNVTFTVNQGQNGAGGDFGGNSMMWMAQTDSNGVATAPPLNANGNAGSFSVTASVNGLSGTAQFDLTIQPLIAISCTVDSVLDPSEAGKMTLRDATRRLDLGGCTSNAITFDPAVFPAAGPQRTIVLADGLGTLPLTFTGGPLTITGPGAGALAVDGNNATTIGYVDNNVTATITDLTVQHGNGIANNDGGGSGGIVVAGTLTVARVTFLGNIGDDGGALVSGDPGASLIVTDSTFIGNGAPGAGGNNNGPEGLGGAIANAGTLTVTNSFFTGNTAGTGGGAIASANHTTVTNSTFTGNSAPDGGAIASLLGFPGITPQLTLTNDTLGGNTAQRGGGVDTGMLVIPQSTKVGAKPGRSPFAKAAPVRGVAIVGTVMLTNALVAGNTGGDIGGDSAPVTITGDHSLIGDGTGGIAAGNGNLLGTVATPLNPLLGPLGTYGSANGTLSFALLPGSIAIDAGTTGGTVPTSDQRGKPRVGAPDIGAFESQGFTLTPAAGATPQSAVVGTPFANPLSLTVTANNAVEPVQGGMVVFTSPASGASAVLAGNPAPIAAGGQASATATANGIKGSYTVTASATGVTTAATFTLTNTAPLVSIAVTPANATLKVGQVQQLTATGTYADGGTADLTGQVTWTSDAPTVASVDTTGKGTGKVAGTAHVTATQGAVSGRATVTVSPPILTGVQPAPAPQSRPSGASVPTGPGNTPAPAPAPAPPSR